MLLMFLIKMYELLSSKIKKAITFTKPFQKKLDKSKPNKILVDKKDNLILKKINEVMVTMQWYRNVINT